MGISGRISMMFVSFLLISINSILSSLMNSSSMISAESFGKIFDCLLCSLIKTSEGLFGMTVFWYSSLISS